jgi:acyl-CoA reductase-like NAD-dependent aldehyde dehydrogenase
MEAIHKFSPVSEEKLGEFPIVGREEVEKAVLRSRSAFIDWRKVPLEERLEKLVRLKTVIGRHADEYARRVSADTGKPLVDSLTTELLSIPLFLDYYNKQAASILKRRRVRNPLLFFGRKSYVEYFPMGVIAIIAPWNFPLQLSVIPMISALIGGNTVILKPSSTTPLSGEIVREMFERIQLPAGVVQVLQGDGRTGQALAEARVDKIFFTGSVQTGRKIMQAAAQRPIPVELELGGKDAMIVLEDANLKRAARAAVWGGLLNCGQMCTSVERILVVEEVHDRFVDLVRQEIGKIKVGSPDEDADVGPMTHQPQLIEVERQVRQAEKSGARVLHGGKRLSRAGSFFEPTLLTGVRPGMRIYQDETFGPVLPILKVKDEQEAIGLTNDHQFGLNASIWTSDLQKGLFLASHVESGQVSVNEVATSVMNPALPFGGVKSSGFGRYHGPDGLLAFMHTRAVTVNRGIFDSEPFWFPYAGKYPALLKTFGALIEKRPLGIIKGLVGLFRQ